MFAHAVPAAPKTKKPAAYTSAKDLRVSLAKLSPELFGRALRMARSPEVAQDLVQDTYERAIRFEAQYQSGTNLRAWDYQILFSVFITRCRRVRRERNAMGVLCSDPCAWTVPTVTPPPQGFSKPVAGALDQLPKVFRDAVMLVDVQELSYKEAARRLRVPVGTVMSRLHRGRRPLAVSLREAFQAPEERLAA